MNNDDDDQSIIDVELEEDMTDSSDSDEIPLKSALDITTDSIDKFDEEALLKILNSIGKVKNLHFNNILEAIKRDNLLKFVTIFLTDDDFLNQMNSSKGKIDDVIKYLQTKYPIFIIKNFDFKNPRYAISSARLFFTTFLNCFFVKKTKQEFLKRINVIVYDSVDKNFNKEIIKNKALYSWPVYLALVNFVNKRTTHFKYHKEKNYDKYFNRKNIPILLDQKRLSFACFFKYYIKKLLRADFLYAKLKMLVLLMKTYDNIIMYQLQFIFNALDKCPFVYYFHECLLTAISKIKNVKVPNFRILAANIRSKNIALILQIKRYKKISKDSQKKDSIQIDDEELNVLKKKSIKMPEKFEERMKSKNSKSTSNLKRKGSNSIKLEKVESYWNPIDSNFFVDVGILVNKKSESNISLIDETSNYEKNIKRNSSSFLKSLKLKKQSNYNTLELFKFFRYNEQLQKWEKNSKSISDCFQKIGNQFLNGSNKISFVLFSNSNENDLIALNSRLINDIYPDLDDGEIYVYALCNKSLIFKEHNADFSEQIIFFLLHVPKSKQKLDNIKTILFKIYFFLSIICDIEIVILDKNHYNDQFELIKNMQNIKRSYKNAFQKKNDKEEPSKKKLKKSKLTTDDNNFSDDGDDDYDYDGYFDDEEEIQNSSNSLIKHLKMNELFEYNNFDQFSKESKYIILINDDSIQRCITEVADNELFKRIRHEINSKFCSINYINVNSDITYHLFLSSFKEFVKDAENDVLSNFELFPLTEINSMYMSIMSIDNWKPKLKECIYDRFKQYKDSNNELSDFNLLLQLSNEIIEMNPSIDSIFHQESNKILGDIKNEIAQKSYDILISELKISSKNNLQYLKQVINEECYWPLEKKDFIVNSHENFLRKEFFSIICSLYSKKDYPFIFNCFSSKLDDLISSDRKIIEQFFLDVENENKPSQEKVVDFIDEMDKGTNYSIRETERVREIKVIAESGNLQDIIPQDF